jgi:hypothetical protein
LVLFIKDLNSTERLAGAEKNKINVCCTTEKKITASRQH